MDLITSVLAGVTFGVAIHIICYVHFSGHTKLEYTLAVVIGFGGYPLAVKILELYKKLGFSTILDIVFRIKK